MGKKETQVQEGILEHVQTVQETVDLLDETVRAYLDGDEAYVEHGRDVHHRETDADRIRKRTERVLFEGAFLPSHREDYFLLLERVDEVADKAEDVANHVVLTRPPVPDDLRDDVRAVADRMVEMHQVMGEAVRALFEDTTRVEKLAEELKEFEERVDEAEFRIVEDLFERDLETADKLLVKEMVEMLARVTDMIEDVGDHVAIFLVKRRA